MQTVPNRSPPTDRGAWLAEVAWRTLAHSASIGLTHACKRLLAEAAFGRPLCLDAVATIETLADDVLAEPDAFDDVRAA